MSSYITEAKNPKTGKVVKAFWIDDYFGKHIYGVGFKKDGTNANWEDTISTDNCDFYRKEQIT